MYNRRHYCNKIKSILHFDYPYINEPDDGLEDGAGFERWKRVGNVKFVAKSIPCDELGSPKFGYRCPKFKIGNYIEGTNKNNIWNLNSDKTYEIEFFIKPIANDLENCYFYKDHTYKFFDNKVLWNSAQTLCEQNAGGHLAIINDKETNNFIKSLQPYNNEYWIGAYTTSSKTWTWVDDSKEWYYTDWNNNYNDDEVFGSISFYNNNNNKWNQHLYGTTMGYLCEWDEYISEIKYESAPIFNIPDNFKIEINENGQIKISSQTFNIEKLSVNILSPNLWNHIMVRIDQNILYLFINGDLDFQQNISSGIIFENIEKVELGNFNGYIDEFIFNHGKRKNSESNKIQVPRRALDSYITKYRINDFGNGELGDVTIEHPSNSAFNIMINSYATIKSADNRTITINNPYLAKTFNGSKSYKNRNNEYDFYNNDEIMIHITSRKNDKYYTTYNSPLSFDLCPFKYYNNHTYRIYTFTTMTWDNAKYFCESVGGHLAIIPNEDVKNFIYNIIPSKENYYYIGGYKNNDNDINSTNTNENTENTWHWINDQEWDEWCTSNITMTENSGNALRINPNKKTWENIDENTEQYFICEWDNIINNFNDFVKLINENDLTGLYAFRTIKKIENNTIIIDNKVEKEFELNNNLLNNYYVQIIKVPHFKNLIIKKSATIIPLTYRSTYGGGIVVFKCSKNCTIDGKIITYEDGISRNDFIQMTNEKLINRFLISRGGGVYIVCGETLLTTNNSRIGSTLSGERAGMGGNSTSPAGKGGTSGNSGGYGFGFAGEIGTSSKQGNGGTGGGQGGSGYNGSINGADGKSAFNSNYTRGGHGGGAPGGDGAHGTSAGANVLIYCKKSSIDNRSISTGAKDATGYAGSGGAGFCYIFANKKLGWEEFKENE